MNNESIESNAFKASRFLHIYKRENIYCLMHSLTQKKIFGGDSFNLYEIFAIPQRIEDVVPIYHPPIPKKSFIV